MKEENEERNGEREGGSRERKVQAKVAPVPDIETEGKSR